jgi:hypothetical protein
MTNVNHRSCTWVMSWRPDSISTWKPSVPITDAKTIIPCNKCQIIQFAGNKSGHYEWSWYCGTQKYATV